MTDANIQVDRFNEKNLLNSKQTYSHYEKILATLAEHASDAEKSIEDRAEELEEGFLNIIFYLFNKHNINRSEKIIISLLDCGDLDVNEHTQRDTILEILKKTPQCLRIMQRLAADALLRRGLQNIRNAHSIEQASANEEENSLDKRIIFQTSIKSDLSHFYLV